MSLSCLTFWISYPVQLGDEIKVVGQERDNALQEKMKMEEEKTLNEEKSKNEAEGGEYIDSVTHEALKKEVEVLKLEKSTLEEDKQSLDTRINELEAVEVELEMMKDSEIELKKQNASSSNP